MVRDYYAILGLSRTATPAEIDAAFRSLAKKYHPDARPVEEDATEQFILAAEAHAVLSNVEKRREYDRVHASRRGRRVPVSGVPFPTSWVKSRPTARPPQGPLHIEAELRLVPEEASRGGLIELRIPVAEACHGCGGQAGTACSICGGEGTVVASRFLRIELPPGLRNGTKLRIPGYGKATGPGGPRGDLLLLVRVRPCW
jgi:DnaJ-class molecular chaperone